MRGRPMREKLIRCICGSKNLNVNECRDLKNLYQVICDVCGRASAIEDSTDKAVKSWNKDTPILKPAENLLFCEGPCKTMRCMKLVYVCNICGYRGATDV